MYDFISIEFPIYRLASMISMAFIATLYFSNNCSHPGFILAKLRWAMTKLTLISTDLFDTEIKIISNLFKFNDPPYNYP